MVNLSALRSRQRDSVPTPLRLLRWIVVAFCVLNLVSVYTSPYPASVHVGVYTVLAWWATAAPIVALYRPLWGALVSIVPIGSTLVIGGHGQDILAFCTVVVMTCMLATPRASLVVVASALAYAVARFVRTSSGEILQSYVGSVVVLAVVGYTVRSLLAVSRRVQGRIHDLEDETVELRREERAHLADELSDLLSDGLAAQQAALTDVRHSDDPDALRAGLATVEQHARESLAQLRGLVSTLRGRGTSPAAASPDAVASAPAAAAAPPLVAQVEEAEDLLVGHGHPTELTLPEPGRRAGDFARRVLGDVVRGAAAAMTTQAPAGAECSISLTIDDDTVAIDLAHPMDASASHADLAPALASAADALVRAGGSFAVASDEGRWTLHASLPQRVTSASGTAEASPGTPATPTQQGRGWMTLLGLRNRGWTFTVPALLRWAAGVAFTVTAIVTSGHASAVFEAGAADWPRTALWVLLWASLAVACWRVWPAVALLLLTLGLTLALREPVVSFAEPALIAALALATLLVTRRRSWWWAVLLGWSLYVLGWFRDEWTFELYGSLLIPVLLGIAAGLGANHFLQLRTLQATHLAEAAEQRRRARDEVRHELAGELHDIVAHQLSLITMQVEAHRRDTDVSALQAGLARIATINQSAQADLALLLHVMRAVEPDAVPASPAEHGWLTATSATRAAAATLRDAGHMVTLDVDESADAADATTLKTVTRVVREATTNILRYAPERAHCTVRVQRDAAFILLEITNPLPHAPRRSAHSTGLGLIGLDERVRITGGELTTGPVDGLWRVHARLPMETTVVLRPRPEDEAALAAAAA